MIGAKASYFFRTALGGMWRHPFVHVVAISSLAIALVGFGLARIAGAQIDALVSALGGEVELTVYLKDGTSEEDLKAPEALEDTRRLAMTRVPSRFQISSMLPGVLMEARDLDAQVPLALIPLGPLEEEDWEMARGAECQWVNIDHDFLDPETMAQAQAAGRRVGYWTVNEVARAEGVTWWGVSGSPVDGGAVGRGARTAGGATAVEDGTKFVSSA